MRIAAVLLQAKVAEVRSGTALPRRRLEADQRATGVADLGSDAHKLADDGEGGRVQVVPERVALNGLVQHARGLEEPCTPDVAAWSHFPV